MMHDSEINFEIYSLKHLSNDLTQNLNLKMALLFGISNCILLENRNKIKSKSPDSTLLNFLVLTHMLGFNMLIFRLYFILYFWKLWPNY